MGVRVGLVALVALGAVIGTASAAFAHGSHGAAPAALFEPAGPYVVSVWIEEHADSTITGNAVIEATEVDSAPEIWLQTAQGPLLLDDVTDYGDGTWTVQFTSTVGDTLVVAWDSVTGDEEMIFALEEIAAPPWFRSTLALVTPPGLWFLYWLMKRRRRAFGLVPLQA